MRCNPRRLAAYQQQVYWRGLYLLVVAEAVPSSSFTEHLDKTRPSASLLTGHFIAPLVRMGGGDIIGPQHDTVLW